MNRWISDTYRTNAAYVPTLGAAVFDLLNPRGGERILDVGCGEGSLTERIVAAGATVVGVDASAEMIAAATARGLDDRLIDAERLTFEREFEAVFSSAALHWVRDHDAMLAGVRGWLETFERATLDRIPPDQREMFLQEVEDLLREEVCDSFGNWTAHYVRLRFLATADV